MHKKLIFILPFIISCSTSPMIPNKISMQEAKQELQQIKPASESDKLRIKHAISNLDECAEFVKDYQALTIRYQELQEKFAAVSKDAGAGDLAFTIIYLIIGGAVFWVMCKILKKLSIL